MKLHRSQACHLKSHSILCYVIIAFAFCPSHCQQSAAATAAAASASTMVVLLVPGNDTGTCLQGCYKGDCGPGTDNYLNLASSCDERLSQLWLISNSNRQLVNVASGYCLSITSENVVTLAACGNELPAQTWSLYANGTLEPASNPGDFLTLCEDGVAGCDPKIMQLISSEGQLTTIAPPSRTGVMASETWEQLSPSVNGSLIQNYWQTASNSGSASFTAAVSASTPWCMQRCSNGDCGDAALDSSLVISSVCDERLDQMWHNDSGTIRSVLNDDCVTICGITSTEAAEAQGDASLAVTCTGAGSDYYNIEARPCTGAANQQWQWQATAVGDVLFSVHTQQAITVCSDLEPWCGYLLLLSFDSSWSARRLTGVRLPSNLSAITQFQTFQPGALTKSMAGDILSSAPATASSVPPAPAAPSEDTASIESFSEGVEEVVPDVAGAAYPPPPPPPPKVFGSFLPVTETTGDVKA